MPLLHVFVRCSGGGDPVVVIAYVVVNYVDVDTGDPIVTGGVTLRFDSSVTISVTISHSVRLLIYLFDYVVTLPVFVDGIYSCSVVPICC